MDTVWTSVGGDDAAVADLFRRYGPRLRRSVARWTRDSDAVDDICQEAWLRALKALPRFRGHADFGTWIHVIARNLAIGGGRSGKRREELLATQLHAGSTPPVPVELRIDLQRAIAELPRGQRKVLWLHDVQGYKHAEIGARLGISEGTSKSQLFKARAQVRRSMKG